MRRHFILGLFAAVLVGCEQPAAPTTQRVSPAPAETAQTVIVPRETPVPDPSPVPEKGPPLLTPAVEVLTVEGHALILEFETGGRSGYKPYPEWPKGASGVTIGIGYDLGYSTPAVIEDDWKALDAAPRARLARVSGKTGQSARTALPGVSDIFVRWTLAIDVFDNVDVARWQVASRRALPGFDKLRLNCQAALISLGFNRGWAMGGPNRAEMRNIRDYGVPAQDYQRIAYEIRHMMRLWRGTAIERGMSRRRNAEADLVLLE